MPIHYKEGKYVCQVISQAFGRSSTGNPQFILRFKVMGTPDPADAEKYIPDTRQFERTYYKSITDKTIEYFVADLKALGFTGSSYRDLDPNTPGYYNMKDKFMDMWCGHEKNQKDELKENWGVAKTATDLKADRPLEATDLRQLDALFGKHLKGSKPATPKTTQPPDDLGISDSDVGF
jgi:hypothetical protein